MNAAPATEQTPKHLVRAWLARRVRERQPPPSLDEIRRQMGWRVAATFINNKQ